MRTFRRSFRPRVKRGFVWVAASNDGFQTVAAGTKLIVPIAVLADGTLDTTLFRVRGFISIVPVQQASTRTAFWGAAALKIEGDKTVTVGTTAVASPYTEPLYDYLWFNYFAGDLAMPAAVTASDARIDYPIHVDAKAKRRLDDTDQLILTVENGGATDISVWYGMRALFSSARR